MLLAGAALGRVALMHLPRHMGIYHLYAEAGRHWLAGESVYADRDGLVFRYSPLVAAAMTPLAILPPWLGNLLFRLVNLGVYMAGLWYWMRWALPPEVSAHRRHVAVLWLLVVPLSVSGLVDVQTNALTIGLLLLAVGAVARQQWNLAAACLVGAVLLKLFPLALVLVLVLIFPRRLGPRFLAALLVGLALPFLLQRPDFVLHEYARWSHLLMLNDRQGGNLNYWYRDIRLPLYHLGLLVGPGLYLVLQALVGGALGALCLWQRWGGVPTAVLLRSGFGLTCAWMMAFGPCTEQTTYIMLAPALAWAALETLMEPQGWKWLVAMMIVYWGSVLIQALLWLPWGTAIHNYGPHGVATVTLLALLWFQALRECRQAQVAVPASLTVR